MRALVVGAGLAGLSAAAAFSEAGCEVSVLEARERVGGRVFSRELDNGAVIELGAEFILPGNTEVLALARRLRLGLWDKGMRYGTREPRGGLGTDAQTLEAAVADLGRALAALSAAEISAAELLDSLDLDCGAREAIEARVEISSAAAADAVPAVDLGGVAQIGAEPAPSIAGGNWGLALGLAEGIGGSIRLGCPVVAIGASADAVTATTVAGEEVAADACVIALPATICRSIEFDPPLARGHAEAIAAVRYGHAAKLFVPLAAPAAPAAVMSVDERYWCWTATQSGGAPAPLVSCFAGSPAALERLALDDGPGTWLDSLARLRPDLALERDGAVLSTWDDDPWVGAAYSVSPGTAVSERLAEPAGRLAFAGEHTAGAWSGLMEGAIRSGRRAAASLLRTR